MRHLKTYNLVAKAFMASMVLALTASAIAAPLARPPQRKSGGSSGGSRPAPSGPAPARREIVRTPNFAPRNNGGSNQAPPTQTRPVRQDNPVRQGNPGLQANPNNGRQGTVRRVGVPSTPQVQVQRKFTKTPQGRTYDNGLRLRKGVQVTATWQKRYFPKGHYHFPYYRPSYVRGSVFISPFGFYFGVCAPFIDISICHEYPPSVGFCDVPLYQGTNCVGYPAFIDENYLNDPNLDSDDPGLLNAVNQITETFQSGNIDALVPLIDPNTMVAVYLRGNYKYSLASSDFVDLTRDAIQSTQTLQFSITYLHQRAPGVFVASGTHTYHDPNGEIRTVYVSYVLQDIGGQWTLTQVGTSPDRVQKWG